MKVLSEKEQIINKIHGNTFNVFAWGIAVLIIGYTAGNVWDIWPVVVGLILGSLFMVVIIRLFDDKEKLMDAYVKAHRKVKK